MLDDYLEALLAGDRRHCEQTVEELLDAGTDVCDVYEDLVQASLVRVGELWESNRISVATEHLATAVSEGLLNLIIRRSRPAPPIGRRGVFTGIERELHQVGIRIVADLFELHGWDSTLLGTNVPTTELVRLLRERPPDLLGLSISLYFSVARLESVLATITSELPELPVVIGGRALGRVGGDIAAAHPKVRYLPDLAAVRAFLAEVPEERGRGP